MFSDDATAPHDNGRGRPCNGTVEFYDGEESGSCNKCGNEINK